jgi:transcriptional regulator with XRE-family HTH domain
MPRRPSRREYERFRERLRTARIRAGLTQEQAAAGLGRPQSYISKVEGGERKLDALEAVSLARLYGCAIECLLAGTRPPL